MSSLSTTLKHHLNILEREGYIKRKQRPDVSGKPVIISRTSKEANLSSGMLVSLKELGYSVVSFEVKK